MEADNIKVLNSRDFQSTGNTTLICTDKSGVLTYNNKSVYKIFAGKVFEKLDEFKSNSSISRDFVKNLIEVSVINTQPNTEVKPSTTNETNELDGDKGDFVNDNGTEISNSVLRDLLNSSLEVDVDEVIDK